MHGDFARTVAHRGSDPEILGITADSRETAPGFLFAALPGSRADGRRFVADAVGRGAVAVLADSADGLDEVLKARPDVALVVDPNPRRRLAQIAARFHAPHPRVIAAVTGTNGKTSVAAFTRQLWQACGRPAASLGTLGIVGPDFTTGGALTTPDPVRLSAALAELKARGIDHAAIEASSHGLDQFRLDGLSLAAGAFTNLTHEHLDYHGTMEAYRAAKLRLFTEVMPRGHGAVLNADSPAFGVFAEACRSRGHRLIAFGRAGRELRLLGQRPDARGQALALEALGRRFDLALPLAGAFQAMNALAALGLVLACGGPLDAAVEALTRLEGAPGRMQLVATHPAGAPVFVDYAHKPDALANVLQALRPLAKARLVVVFGCGGDRDTAKRPMMGEIAHRMADRVIVTDDNPRSEDPALIRRAILEACPKGEEIGDRAEAIRAAIAGLARGDVLVIAGKGHERGQIVGATVRPFDDAEAARAAVTGLGKGGRA